MKIIFSWVDIVVFLFLILFSLRGYKRGLSGEIFRSVGFLLAFMLAYQFFGTGAVYLQKIMPVPDSIAALLAYVIIFFLVYLGCYFVRIIIQKLMNVSFIAGLDKGGGLFVGIIKGLCFLSVIFVLLGMLKIEFINDYMFKKSLTPPYVMPITPYIYDSVFIPLGEKYSGKVKGFDKQAFFMQLDSSSIQK